MENMVNKHARLSWNEHARGRRVSAPPRSGPTRDQANAGESPAVSAGQPDGIAGPGRSGSARGTDDRADQFPAVPLPRRDTLDQWVNFHRARRQGEAMRMQRVRLSDEPAAVSAPKEARTHITKIHIDFCCNRSEMRLSSAIESTFYNVTQATICNISKRILQSTRVGLADTFNRKSYDSLYLETCDPNFKPIICSCNRRWRRRNTYLLVRKEHHLSANDNKLKIGSCLAFSETT